MCPTNPWVHAEGPALPRRGILFLAFVAVESGVSEDGPLPVHMEWDVFADVSRTFLKRWSDVDFDEDSLKKTLGQDTN